jgi:cytidine deaminase
MNINWDEIKLQASKAMQNAYVPYSKFKVGVAALVNDGRIISGCNVENASYGLGLCAECGLVSNLMLSGGGRLIAVVCVDAESNYLAPCGRCRQLLFEHGGESMLLMTPEGPKEMISMLPWAFGPDNLKDK